MMRCGGMGCLAILVLSPSLEFCHSRASCNCFQESGVRDELPCLLMTAWKMRVYPADSIHISIMPRPGGVLREMR